MESPTSPQKPDRLSSLDQFRGYTVVGMLLVNFLGGYSVVPEILKHHNTYNSYADTIMPQFFFAVGFAYRLTFLRRYEIDGAGKAYGRVLRRLGGLFLVSLVVHAPGKMAHSWEEFHSLGPWNILGQAWKNDYFQTLMHITFASLWVTPVIRRDAAVRIAYGLFSIGLHVFLSWWFYFTWLWADQPCIDGGPLGFLTWSVAVLGGTLACDLAKSGDQVVSRMLGIGAILMLGGWILSCGTRMYDVTPSQPLSEARAGAEASEGIVAVQPVFPSADVRSPLGLAEPPFVPPPESRLLNYWMMSQRAGTASYLLFSTGLCFAVFAFFYVISDRGGWSLGLLRTFGSNALVAYIVHSMVDSALQPFAPSDAPALYLAVIVGIYFTINYAFLRSLERQGMFLRI